MVCAQCLVWSLWIHIASLSLFELFGLSFVRAGKNGDLIAQAPRKTFVPIVVKVHSGRQSKWPLGKPLLANIAILDTEFRSCWHHLKNKTEVRWTWSQIACFSWGVISAEWPARLTLHRRLRVGWVDRIKGRISHSVEGPKFVPFPCGRPFPSLRAAKTLQLVVCVYSRPQYPSRASGGSCSRRGHASSNTETTWNGTCMPCSTGLVHIDTHVANVAEQQHASFEITGPACFRMKQAWRQLLMTLDEEGRANEKLLWFWLITTRCQMGI